MTLLAFKPFILKEGRFAPLSNPDWEWPGVDQRHIMDYRLYQSPKIVTTCARHTLSQIPDPDCTCGIYSSLDTEMAAKYILAKPEDSLPVMLVIQVLGKTVVDGLVVRSNGAYLWGVINSPSWLPATEIAVWMYSHAKYPPGLVEYNLEEAAKVVRATWRQYTR